MNVALPYAVYVYFKASLGDVHALLASMVPPLVWSTVEFIRRRRIDMISILIILGIAFSLLAFVGGGSVKFLQLRENLVTGVIGLAFLGSLVIRRPLIYELARATKRRQSDEKLAEFERRSTSSGFRRVMGLLTLVWGCALLLTTAVACVLVFVLPIETYLIVGPISGTGIMGLTVLWSLLYVRSKERQASR